MGIFLPPWRLRQEDGVTDQSELHIHEFWHFKFHPENLCNNYIFSESQNLTINFASLSGNALSTDFLTDLIIYPILLLKGVGQDSSEVKVLVL